ncbi:coproporphyrinogen III oxidase [Martelella alba]|uniref:Heme chaperone HemW n=1 Tax=Martelella alba TaxID=2590451 RepID=A0A506U431_9HYPH|nr:radical SAM family heme chaperone HemW [Martelella alba]TPW28086.1 coproporphyrinogen III oxidase [Martelella alba]
MKTHQDHRGRVNGDDGEPGFGIYLHWPFCAAKCPYCDFNSHVRHQAIDQARFANAFAAEIAHMRALSGPRTVTSIFFGGGTPSLMEPTTLATILDAVANAWHVPDGIEVTLEANPSSVEADRFRGYRAAGVNRVSLGVQALNDKDLRFLGRLHNLDQALGAISLAREIFPRMSFDLIYARPDQRPDDWADELRQAIGLSADHLSLYQLTIEEGTAFFGLHRAGKIIIPDEDHAADLYEITQAVTSEHGLPAYEVSNHAIPGAESRHNLTYWRYGDYAGIGPGAHGRLGKGGEKRATATERHPETWLEAVEQRGNGIIEESLLTAEEQADEMLLMGLRVTEGLDIARWADIAGHGIDPDREAFLTDLGLIQRIGNRRIRATGQGMLVLNRLVEELSR